MFGKAIRNGYGIMCCRMLFSRAICMTGVFGCLLRPDQR